MTSNLTPKSPVSPLAVFHLHGTQVQMGQQHGELQRALGGHEEVAAYYPTMPTSMLRGSAAPGIMRTLPGLVGPAIDGLTRRLYQDRPAEDRARSEAFVQAAGFSPVFAQHMLAMDVFQNLVGVAGRVRVVPQARALTTHAIQACSSLCVWDKAADGAELLHARNFDFPGHGIWDAVPTVLFCTPDSGLRYGYTSTRGNDAAVVSLWNEAGISLTTHTRLHRDVRFGGAAIADLAHDIIRHSRTLADAEAIVRRRGVASTWGLLVSSLHERSAVVIETTAKGVAVTRAGAGQSHLSCTNHYLAAALRPGELAPNSGFTAHTHGRMARLERAVREAPGGLTAADLQSLLGDHHDGEIPDLERGSGGVLAQPTGVHSIVIDPAGQRCFVSTGPAPSGRGTYAEIPWQWSTKSGVEVVATDRSVQPPRQPSRFDGGPGAAGYAHYSRAVSLETHGAEPAATAVHIARAAAADPQEPTWQLLRAGFAMRSGDLDEAAAALDQGLATERAPFYRGRFLLWSSRVAALQGHTSRAMADRSEVLALRHPHLGGIHAAAQQDAAQAYPRQSLRHVPIQCLMGALG